VLVMQSRVRRVEYLIHLLWRLAGLGARDPRHVLVRAEVLEVGSEQANGSVVSGSGILKPQPERKGAVVLLTAGRGLIFVASLQFVYPPAGIIAFRGVAAPSWKL
jgi:hypothetical protein